MANDDTNGFYLIPQSDDTLPNFEAQYFKSEFNLKVPKYSIFHSDGPINEINFFIQLF